MKGSCLKFSRIALVALVVTVAGCSRRQRLNPLDPANPETGGRPGGLSVFSLDHDVTLAWEVFDFEGIDGFNLYRKIEGEDDFRKIAFLPPDENGYTDKECNFDITLSYRISVVSGDYESPFSDSVWITPGPHTYWILDYYGSSVSRWTYDALHLISYKGMDLWPEAMALDTRTQTVWVLFYQDYLLRLSYDGEYLNWISGLRRPDRIGFNTSNGTVWVSNEEGTQLKWYSTSGLEMGSLSGFGKISDIACPGNISGCWIADSRKKTLSWYRSSGQLGQQFETAYCSPRHMAHFIAESWMWIADSLNLYRISTNGEVLSSYETDRPVVDMDVDIRGNCWVLVNHADTGEGSVYKISPSGEELVRKDAFRYALSVAAVEHNHGCLVADTGNGRIVRLSEEGDILTILDGFPSPQQILVD